MSEKIKRHRVSFTMMNNIPTEWCSPAEVSALESRLEEAEEFIESVKDWKNAYQEDVFPPVGEDSLKMMCNASGISMDRLSAAILRKCIIGWCNSAEAFLKATK